MAASSRPKRSAPDLVGSPASIHSSASRSGNATSTSGNGGPSGVRSHSMPYASDVKKPSGAGAAAFSGQVLTKSEAPSSRVSREAAEMLPPATGVSRIR